MSQKSSQPHPSPAAVGHSPITGILLATRFERPAAGATFQATSLPGHLLHLVIRGRVRQECNGRQYELRPGAVMWYHEDELVRGVVLEAPWTFYSINFLAPTLPPPEFDQRLFPNQARLQPLFEALRRAWVATDLPAPGREFRVHAALLQILGALPTRRRQVVHIDPGSQLWWELETACRRDLRRPITLAGLADLAQRSPATVRRSCLQAVGLPPLKRLKQVRLSLARGLVRQSQLPMKEIADRIGYPRIHEFSRDYRKHFGLPPTHDRQRKGNRE